MGQMITEIAALNPITLTGFELDTIMRALEARALVFSSEVERLREELTLAAHGSYAHSFLEESIKRNQFLGEQSARLLEKLRRIRDSVVNSQGELS